MSGAARARGQVARRAGGQVLPGRAAAAGAAALPMGRRGARHPPLTRKARWTPHCPPCGQGERMQVSTWGPISEGRAQRAEPCGRRMRGSRARMARAACCRRATQRMPAPLCCRTRPFPCACHTRPRPRHRCAAPAHAPPPSRDAVEQRPEPLQLHLLPVVAQQVVGLGLRGRGRRGGRGRSDAGPRASGRAARPRPRHAFKRPRAARRGPAPAARALPRSRTSQKTCSTEAASWNVGAAWLLRRVMTHSTAWSAACARGRAGGGRRGTWARVPEAARGCTAAGTQRPLRCTSHAGGGIGALLRAGPRGAHSARDAVARTAAPRAAPAPRGAPARPRTAWRAPICAARAPCTRPGTGAGPCRGWPAAGGPRGRAGARPRRAPGPPRPAAPPPAAN
jgi:hypothetical protein